MTTMTSYGTWNARTHSTHLTLRGELEEALDGWPGIDIDAVESDYRAAINAALPQSVSLCGDEFYGHALDADCADQAGYPHDEDGVLDIAAIVESVDLREIVDRHDHEVFEVVLPEVGPMRIEHHGEDTDIVVTGSGVRPAVVDFAQSEHWEPDVYSAALLAAGWRMCGEWESDGPACRAWVTPVVEVSE